jgi:hypothetical protein
MGPGDLEHPPDVSGRGQGTAEGWVGLLQGQDVVLGQDRQGRQSVTQALVGGQPVRGQALGQGGNESPARSDRGGHSVGQPRGIPLDGSVQ